MNPAKWPWKIRAVQLDLARRYESVQFILDYCDFCADHGFNTLVLYLEARVNTASFTYPDAQESYSAQDMARVVEYAATRGIEVIPVVPTLAHCELFFKDGQLRHLSEEREGHSRFGGNLLRTFCPTQEATYEFLERYLGEIAAMFPSSHLHIGCDEAWNLGLCPTCSPQVEQSGLADLFLRHVDRVCQIVRSAGKRPMMWDDFFEFFSEKLEELSKDVILCLWNYEPVIEPEGPVAHFANRKRSDLLAEYARLGLEVLVCPWAASWLNVETITDYARRHNVLGGLLTQWEMGPRPYAQYDPIIKAAGKLWTASSYDPKSAWDGQPDTIRALSLSSFHNFPWNYNAYLRGPLVEGERNRRNFLELALSSMRTNGEDIHYPALVQAARSELVYWNLRELAPQIFDPRLPPEDAPLLKLQAAALRREMEELKETAPDFWDGISPTIAPLWEKLEAGTDENDWLLILRLFLPDVTAAPLLKVTIGDPQQSLGNIHHKPPTESVGSHYTVCVPFRTEKAPQWLELEVTRYGGLGIAFLEVHNWEKILFPAEITSTSGLVDNANALLLDDSHVAYLGSRDVEAAILNSELAKETATVRVLLKEE